MLGNVHIAQRIVKSKCTPLSVHIAQMSDDPDDIRPDESKRLQQAREARGFKTAKGACEYFGWNYNSYIQHERGLRGIGKAAKKYAGPFKVSEAWLLTGEGGQISDEDWNDLALLRKARDLGKLAEARSFLRYLASEIEEIRGQGSVSPGKGPEAQRKPK